MGCTERLTLHTRLFCQWPVGDLNSSPSQKQSFFRTCYNKCSGSLLWLLWNSPCTPVTKFGFEVSRLRLKRDGTRAETRFCLSAKRTSPFKSAGASVQSTTGSRSVRIGGNNAGYTMFWGSVRGTGYPPYFPVSPSLPLPCVTVCNHVSTGLYNI